MGSESWNEFVEHARPYVAIGALELEKYKIEISQKLGDAREAVLSGSGDWVSLVRRGLTGHRAHPMPWQQADNLYKWASGFPEDALTALRAIWTEDDLPVAERIRTFSHMLPGSVISRTSAGIRANVASVLLMGLNVNEYPPFRIRRFKSAYARAGYDQPRRGADEAELYEHALGFLDRFVQEAKARELPVRDRLDGQSLVWLSEYPIAQIRHELPPIAPSEDADDNVTEEVEYPRPYQPPSLQSLASRLYLPVSFLKEIEILLEDKKQVIFQGPPGTGKTYVAQKLARHLAESDERVTLVQLHPSYAYEDFVQGFRPTLDDKGQPGFELRDGPLLRAARRARSEPGEKHFLVVDEINRGAPAKVLGELYFLLEYRDEKVRLQYQRDDEEDFSLPPNLYFIGTMNTADRSIALVDLALRRRFYFVEFHPDDEPVKSVLRRWIDEKAPGMEWVADVVERANVLLQEDRHAAIGPSYFMKDGLDETAVERIWKHSVLSYIEERLFGEGDRLGQFDLDRLRRETGHSAAQGQDVGPEGDEEDGTQ